ncbi:DUF2777 domain-containing protein [Metabacillus sp. GX 13764]|uniref:DUF2777 family protein n=1 Tax=Metabacillus kandeliae TaxID=2900151 RepID=UPI001E61DAA2|nr:DUF2777 family protein [Metabacillus kandeliae]MCD7034909.1 DUF2777 domain-containing protein [Metabacillus kandeliae]
MSEQNRTELLQVQDRSYMIGMIQQLEEEWFFIEEDEDQMVLLETLNTKELEIFLEEKWQKAKLAANGKIKGPFGTHVIHEDDCFRMKKPLPYALDQMLQSLSDKTFEEFAKQLNSLGFSIFDCVYSYNQLLFLSRKKRKKGVSFFQFDNEEGICAVQHHFERGTAEGDRFEFTTSFGKRAVLSYSA